MEQQRGIAITQADATQTIKRVERRQSIGLWVGGSFATLGLFAILGMLKSLDWNEPGASGGVTAVVLMLGFGSRTWWLNLRRLKATRRALLFLTQPCKSTLHQHLLTVQLQQLVVFVPLTGKVATALAQRALPLPR